MKKTTPLLELYSKQYRTPEQVQKLVRGFDYNRELNGETARSALTTLNLKTAHCLEACLVTAAILEHHGYPPLVLSLDAIDHLNHVVFVYHTPTGWGSVGRSREPGLHGRAPRFRSIRDLAWSYYDPFVDKTGKLIGYALCDLDESQTDWRASTKNLWKLEKFIVSVPYIPLHSSERRYQRLFQRYAKHGSLQSGKHWR